MGNAPDRPPDGETLIVRFHQQCGHTPVLAYGVHSRLGISDRAATGSGSCRFDRLGQ